MVAIFYINLAKRVDRKQFMESQLSALGLSGTRVEAVTPFDISASDIARYCDRSKPTFLRENELACSLSHERAWQMMIDAGHERALILEDDAQLSTLLPAFLAEADSVDVDLIRIETQRNPTRVFPVISTGASGVSLRGFRSTPYGSAGYILRASAAKRVMGNAGQRTKAFDMALYSPFDEPGSLLSRVLTEPALCRQYASAAEAAGQTVGQSDVDVIDAGVRHDFARKHPVRHAALRFVREVRRSVRNVTDHFGAGSRKAERRVIPFQ